MGFYLRKSLKAGPFRLNLSKSGIGVSAGVKGFRFGTGPRGNYVHAGRGGFYYRASIPSVNKPSQKTSNAESVDVDNQKGLTIIESDDVTGMVDSSAIALLDEINEKHGKISLFPAVIIVSLFILICSFWHFHNVVTAVIFLIAIIGVIYVKNYDDLRKSVLLFYDFEPEIEAHYQTLHDTFDQISSCSRIWHIEAQGKTNDWKRNSGATSLVKRKAMLLIKGAPPYVKTNISIPIIPVGKKVLYFFPERVLVFDRNKFGAVNYNDLAI